MSENNPRHHLHAELKRSHTPQAISDRLSGGPRLSYLRDFIYGSIDGTVTTFAIVSGVTGAALSPGIVVILGVANLLADGFSMAVSNFLGIRSEEQQREKARRTEELHIAAVPEGEREEIRQIFAAKGFRGADLESAVDVITSDMKEWVDTMLREELGIPLEGPSPVRAALTTLVAFIAVGCLPLLSFIAQVVVPGAVSQPFLWSSILTGVAFFAVGAFKSRFIDESWYRAGTETLLVGGCAAVLAYLAGFLLRDVVAVT